MNYRPSRLKVLGVYSKRLLRRRRISRPFISGDGIASLCDITFDPPKFHRQTPSEEQILKANSIFVRSDQLELFLDRFGDKLSARVIVCGNSDFEFHEMPRNLPDSVQLLLLQNSFISDGARVRTLPIGLENYRWGVNGNPKHITQSRVEIGSERILFGPFGDTHQARYEIKRFLQDNASDKWNYIDDYIEPPEYDKLVREFRYVAAVRGNGVDTHRLWETLYRNRFPIIQESHWSRSLRSLGLPIIEIQDWGIQNLTDAINQFGSLENFDVRQLSALWLPYWGNLIQKN